MPKERLIWADSLKGWLMLLVILGHAIQFTLTDSFDTHHLWNAIYSFHMPAFMTISGWLAYRGRTEIRLLKTIKRRAQQLLIPYFIWSMINYTLSVPYTMEMALKMITHPDNYFWFLWVLFWINVIFLGARWLAERMHISEMLTIGACCALLMGVMVGMELRTGGFQFIACYFLFYTLGYMMHRYSKLCIHNTLILTLSLVLWAIMAWYWNMHALPSWMPAIPHVPSSLLQYAYRGLTALFAILVLLNVSPKILNGKDSINKRMVSVGELTLGIYVIHLTLMGYIVKVVETVTRDEAAQVTISFLTATVISCLIALLLQKNRITAKYLLGKNS